MDKIDKGEITNAIDVYNEVYQLRADRCNMVCFRGLVLVMINPFVMPIWLVIMVGGVNGGESINYELLLAILGLLHLKL